LFLFIKKENKMDESALKIEVAACCRLFEFLGLFDFSGHASVRIPGTDNFLVNSRDSVRSIITPKDIVKVNLDGKVLEEGARVPSEIFIYTAIYKLLPDVFAIGHLHSPAIISLSVLGKEYVPVIARGSIFPDGIPVSEDSRLINSRERGDALAKALGLNRAVILRGHGSVVVGESIKAVLFRAYFSELNAKYQLDAYRIGEKPRPLPEDEIKEANEHYFGRLYEKVWNYFFHKANINF
jgi:ribulose-5-phosphate 4-epimerase/fuculose-1-phosphate aldolase